MNRPAAVEITNGCMKFLITHNPTDATLNKFTEVSLRPRPAEPIRPRSYLHLPSRRLSGIEEIPREHAGESL